MRSCPLPPSTPAPTSSFGDLRWGPPLHHLPWRDGGLCWQEPVSLPAGGCWPFKACSGATARLGKDSDHRCQVVKLKILSDVDAQAAGARQSWLGRGREGSGMPLSSGGGAVGSKVWGSHLGDLEEPSPTPVCTFLQPLECSRMHSQWPHGAQLILGILLLCDTGEIISSHGISVQLKTWTFSSTSRDTEAQRRAGDQFTHLWIQPTFPEASWGLFVKATEMDLTWEPSETQTAHWHTDMPCTVSPLPWLLLGDMPETARRKHICIG